MRSLWMLRQGCSLFNRSSGFRHQKLQYKCPELNLTQVHAFPTCFVAVRLALERTCRKIHSHTYTKKLLHYFLGALKVTAMAWMLHWKSKHSPNKSGSSHCRFEKLYGVVRGHLMQHWMQVTPQQKPRVTHMIPIWSQSFRELSVFVSLSL